MRIKLKEFDPSAYLDNDEVIAEYLSAALEDGNPDVFLSAIGNVAKARGMSAIAENTGLGRESLYKALAPGAKPRYDTVLKLLHSFGVRLSVTVQPGCRRVDHRGIQSDIPPAALHALPGAAS
jgi:probable addiction module antidote protein